MRVEIILVWVLQLAVVRSQNKCTKDEDCKEDAPCCSQFGFCGDGEGFCTDVAVDESRRPVNRQGGSGVNRAGSGCTVDDLEYIGGDLPPIVGGGGVRVDRNSSKECFNKCEENFRCGWFTYDERARLCYLKGTRGYPRNRTDGFVSGSTDRQGCDRDPECRFPYSFHSYQCQFYCEQGTPQDISLADVRRNFNDSKEFCGQYGGFLPYQLQGYGQQRYADSWHWLGYGGDGGNCWAGRPNFWDQGVRSFPCSENLNFACERQGRFPVHVPRRPTTYIDPLPPPNYIGSGHVQFPRRRLGLTGRRRVNTRRRLGLARRRYLINSLHCQFC